MANIGTGSREHSWPKINPSLINIVANRNAMTRFLHGSASMRDVLRERCKARVKENRWKLIQHLRNLPSQAEIQSFIHSSFREEMLGFTFYPDVPLDDYIDESLDTQTEMKNETLTAEEECVMKECDALLADDELYTSLLQSSVNEVVCPLCQKDKMFHYSKECIACYSCGAVVPSTVSLEIFREKIHLCIDAHSESCCQKPLFSLTPEEDKCLLMMCTHCSFLSLVV